MHFEDVFPKLSNVQKTSEAGNRLGATVKLVCCGEGGRKFVEAVKKKLRVGTENHHTSVSNHLELPFTAVVRRRLQPQSGHLPEFAFFPGSSVEKKRGGKRRRLKR